MLSNLFLIFLKKSEYKIVSEIITEPVLTDCSKILIGRINQPTYFFAILDRTVFFSHLGVCVYELFRSYQHKAKRFQEVIIEILSRLSVDFCNTYRGISSSQNQYKGRMQSRKFSIYRQILQEGSLLKSSLALFLTEQSGVSVLTPRFCR